MKLTIEIPCEDGLQMENNLNKAIDDFSRALKDKGLSEMELEAYLHDDISNPIYKLSLKK